MSGFSRIVASIYATTVDRARWAAALQDILAAFHGNHISLIVKPCTAGEDGLIVSAGVDHAPIFSERPSFPSLEESPFTAIALNRVVLSTDILPDAQWRASDYYNKWCKPHDAHYVMAADLGAAEGGTYGFRVSRPESASAFSETDRELGRQLLPHLKQALDIYKVNLRHREIGRLYGRAMAGLGVGVLVLDEDARLVEHNATAAAILDSHDGLRVVAQRLHASSEDQDRAFQGLIRAALVNLDDAQGAPAQAMSISRPSGKIDWGVVIRALPPDLWSEGTRRPSVSVFVRDCESVDELSERFVRQLFRLTPAESSLVAKLVAGQSLMEAARALNIRHNTARAYLRSIFSKTGARRQAELVRIFLNSVAWFDNPEK